MSSTRQRPNKDLRINRLNPLGESQTILRSALRLARRNRIAIVITVVALGMSVASNIAVFAVFSDILLEPLPYENRDRLIRIYASNNLRGRNRATVTPADYFDLRNSDLFATTAAWFRKVAVLSVDGGDPERTNVAAVSRNFFSALGVHPEQGRLFSELPGREDYQRTIILKYTTWVNRYNRNPDLESLSVRIDGVPFTVIGVLPVDCTFPFDCDYVAVLDLDNATKARRDWHVLNLIALQEARGTLDSANSKLAVFAKQIGDAHPDTSRDWSLYGVGFREDLVRTIKPLLVLLFATTAVLVILALCNGGIFIALDHLHRSDEFATRIALGATRPALARQLLAEVALLVLLVGAMSWVGASWFLQALHSAYLPEIRNWPISLHEPQILLYGSTIGIIVPVVAYGLISSFTITQCGKFEAMRPTKQPKMFTSWLVIVQFMITATLLYVALLLHKSQRLAEQIPSGFEASNVVTFQLNYDPKTYANSSQVLRLSNAVSESLSMIPGVRSSAATSNLPFTGGAVSVMRIAGRPSVSLSEAQRVRWFGVTSGFFRAMRIRLVGGREITDDKWGGNHRVVLINRTLANRDFAGEDPIGQRIDVAFNDPPLWAEIIGIVDDVKVDGLEAETPAQAYGPIQQGRMPERLLFVVRFDAGAAPSFQVVKATIGAIDRDCIVSDYQPLSNLTSTKWRNRVMFRQAISAFAGGAGIVALLGIYTVTALSVKQQRKKFAIKIALGARNSDIHREIFLGILKVSLLGIAMGIAVAHRLSGALAELLFQTQVLDIRTIGWTSVLLALGAMLCGILPARQASQIDPSLFRG